MKYSRVFNVVYFDGTNGQEVVDKIGGTFFMDNGVLSTDDSINITPAPKNVYIAEFGNNLPLYMDQSEFEEKCQEA